MELVGPDKGPIAHFSVADWTRVGFRHFTLEAVIDAIDVAGDQETANRLWQRYCNFQRVYDAALAVIAPKTSSIERKFGSPVKRTQSDRQTAVSESVEVYNG